MTQWSGPSCLLGVVAASMLAGLAFADRTVSRAQDDTGDKVSRLEKLLNAQQRRVDSLEQQLAAARAQEEDAARVEAMRQQSREVLSEQEFRESLR
ncbi:MAG: hypothetical protein ACE5I3_02605 [Phycisphaerae bacterium]